jgi:hypothetical protein
MSKMHIYIRSTAAKSAISAIFLFVLVLSLITTVLAGDAPIVKSRGFTFVTPMEWTVVRPSANDVARFTISEGFDTAEVTFPKSGYGGQSAAGDAEFWFSEFSGSASTRYLESEWVGSVKITYVTTQGTFTPDPDSGKKGIKPRTGYALYGAILEGKTEVAYVKMVGPAGTVSESREEFKHMVVDAAKTAATKMRKSKPR